ncbi:MAG: hypothetical protein WCY22_02130 [Acholeplasmataceae bacterium]
MKKIRLVLSILIVMMFSITTTTFAYWAKSVLGSQVTKDVNVLIGT